MSKFQILQGDSAQTLKQFPDNHFDSIVTDPPYGINFLNKDWDAHTGSLEIYQECLRVLKPGGHLLAFSAARTYHHLAITLEQAGFEIRDQIMWIYSSGFPKSQDVGKSIDRAAGKKGIQGPLKRGAERMINATDENGNRTNTNGVWANEVKRNPYIMLPETPEAEQWAGWGTQLKPAHEPIALARKPLKQSVARNVQEWGTGALNIDATRVGDELIQINQYNAAHYVTPGDSKMNNAEYSSNSTKGRFPSNVIGDIPDYQKYFYCPKVSRKERHIGFNNIKSVKDQLADIGGYFCNLNGGPIEAKDHTPLAFIPTVGIVQSHSVIHHINQQSADTTTSGNNHPTVKPVALMRYLIRLVTPPGGKVLDPFTGSGSTGMAAVELGHEFTGCELDPDYARIANTRISAWSPELNQEQQTPTVFDSFFGGDHE